MKLGKLLALTLICVILTSFAITLFPNPTDNLVKADPPDMQYWGEQTFTLITRDAMPALTRLNISGETVIMLKCVEWYKLSYDNGSTWYPSGTTWWEIPGYGAVHDEMYWTLHALPNGTSVIVGNMGRADLGGTSPCGYSEEFNTTPQIWIGDWNESLNGSGSFDWYQYNITTWGIGGIENFWMWNATLYGAFVNEFCDDAWIIKSPTGLNGSWSKYGVDNLTDSTSDEFCAFFNKTDDQWCRTIHRDQGGWTHNLYTDDYGETWYSTGEDLPTSRNRNPYTAWIDDDILLLNSETDTDEDGEIWYSNNSGISWTKLFTMSDNDKNHYGNVAVFPKGVNGRSTSLGGMAIVCVQHEIDTPGPYYVKTFFVANNATLDWDWPPGEQLLEWNTDAYGEEEEDVNVSFVSINGEDNNSVVLVGNRTLIWTNVTDAIFYNLQISNSSNFATTFVNYTDISYANYPSHFSYQGSNVQFILPTEIQWFGVHYYRVRVST